MNSPPTQIEDRQTIYRRLVEALTLKQPAPPPDWSEAKLDEEILTATAEYNPNRTARFVDAATTALFYLADFAARMPSWIDVSERNKRVGEMCRDIAAEIERIVFEPNTVIAERGKLKSWLKAILAVQTCLIYREQTERAIARDKAAKRAGESPKANAAKMVATQTSRNVWQSSLAEKIWNNAKNSKTTSASSLGKAKVSPREKPDSDEQLGLF